MRWVGSLWLCFLVSGPVRADEGRLLFVPVLAHQSALPAWLEGALDELAHSAELGGATVWSREEAAQRFERRHSSELSPIAPEDVQTLERLNDSAVKSMAAQHHAAALHELDAASRLYQRSPEEFNRLAPRVVLDMCLFRARASVESGEQVLGVKRAVRDCRLRIPLEIEPNLLTHTNPTIRRLLAEVSAELASSRGGRLTVRGPPGCMARIDGVDAGRLRGGLLQFEDLLLGAHRVSAACEGADPRIYTVEVTAADSEVTVDGVLDPSVRSRPCLYLSAQPTTSQAELEREGRVIAESLHATSVVLVGVTPEGPLVLRRLAREGVATEVQLAAPSQIGQAWPVEVSAAALDALLRPKPEPALAQRVEVPEPLGPPPLLTGRELQRWKRASAAMLTFAGAGVVSSMVLHLRARSLRSEHRAEYEERAQSSFAPVERAHRFGVASLTLGMMQSVWLGVGLQGPLLRRLALGRSNAAWMSSMAAVGVVLLGASVAPFVRARAEGSSEVARDDRSEKGFLLVGHGAGLLAAPLFLAAAYYLPIRLRTTSLAVLPGGRVGVGGTF